MKVIVTNGYLELVKKGKKYQIVDGYLELTVMGGIQTLSAKLRDIALRKEIIEDGFEPVLRDGKKSKELDLKRPGIREHII